MGKHPSKTLILAPNDVHVWCASLDDAETRREGQGISLTPDEQERSNRFNFERDRQRFLVGRRFLRALIGRYTGEPYPHPLCYTDHGKPMLPDLFDGNQLCFNVSHSRDLVLYAFTWNHAVGVDVEHVRHVTHMSRIVERFFSRHERTLFYAQPPNVQQVCFFNAWTRKEAYLKAQGVGLANSLTSVEVSFLPGEPATFLHLKREDPTNWFLKALTPLPGYVGAVVVKNEGVPFRHVSFRLSR